LKRKVVKKIISLLFTPAPVLSFRNF